MWKKDVVIKKKVSLVSTLVVFTASLLYTAGVLAGCATTRSTLATKVREADEQMVSQCEYLGDVAGTSGWGNLAASTGINNAKNEAFEKAAKLGATHIMWTEVSGGYSPFVNGRAYRCDD